MPKRRKPLRLPDDSAETSEAISWMLKRGLKPVRVSRIQLKLGDLNYYPDVGTMYVDGGKRMKESGLDALERVLCSRLNRRHLPTVLENDDAGLILEIRLDE